MIWNVEAGQKQTGPQIAWAERQRTQLYHSRAQVLGEIRIPDLPRQPGCPVFRGTALRHEHQRRGDANLHRLDEVLLLHQQSGPACDFRALRLHAGRFAGGRPNRGPASRRFRRPASRRCLSKRDRMLETKTEGRRAVGEFFQAARVFAMVEKRQSLTWNDGHVIAANRLFPLRATMKRLLCSMGMFCFC